MKKRNLQNEELDRIGCKLLGATKAQSAEIEQIVGSPMLFESIKARIETERRERNSKTVFGSWANLQSWNWQKVSAMVLLLFIAGVISLAVFGKFTQQQIENAAATQTKSPVEQIENQPLQMMQEFSEDSPATVKTKNPVIESPKIAKQKGSVIKITEPPKLTVQSPKRQPSLRLNRNEPAGKFYALTFGGNPNETGEELKIVRAELSRSSLFALGVNLPIENESEKIKTDLLVGADGVARAIRLVNRIDN